MIPLMTIGILIGYAILCGIMAYIGEEFLGIEGFAMGLFWPIILPVMIGWYLMELIFG